MDGRVLCENVVGWKVKRERSSDNYGCALSGGVMVGCACVLGNVEE